MTPVHLNNFDFSTQGFRVDVEPKEFVHTFAVVKQRASDPLGIGIIEQPTLEGAVRCIVANVAQGSPAYATGLRPGFNILSIDGHYVEHGSLVQIRAALAAGGIRVVITAKLLHDKWCVGNPSCRESARGHCWVAVVPPKLEGGRRNPAVTSRCGDRRPLAVC